MALLGQGFNAAGYTPDYSVANKANEQFFQARQKSMEDISNVAINYQEEGKKQKAQEGAIKSIADRIDGIIKAFPDKKNQFLGVKNYILNQSIPIEERMGYSTGIDSQLNDIYKFATEQRAGAAEARAGATGPNGMPTNDLGVKLQ